MSRSCMKALALAGLWSCLVLASTTECFTSPSYSGRSASSYGPGGLHQHNHGGEISPTEYTNNYIMAIEDQTTEPAGFMVSTTDHNYAIQSPRLGEFDWLGVTVNGGQVFISTKENRTLSANLFTLAEAERDFIAEVRANFTQNLAGLKFAYYTSGSSLALSAGAYGARYPPPPPPSGYAGPSYSAPSAGAQGHYYPAATTGPKYYSQEPASVASHAISQLNDAHYVASLREHKGQSYARGLYEPSSGVSTEEARYSLSALGGFARKRSIVGEGASYSSPSDYKYTSSRTRRLTRNKKHALAHSGHPSGAYRIVDTPRHRYGNKKHSSSSPSSPKYSKCAFDHLVNLNYYNLAGADQARLNRTLVGDIYYFDFHCNILDIYSSTVSVRRQPNASILYRDHRYFSYSGSRLPLEINRIFLVGDHVFFVYNDGSLLLKQSWMLEPAELDLVLKVRHELKSVSEWQGKAADLLSKSGGGGTTTTTTSTTTPAPPQARTTPQQASAGEQEEEENGEARSPAAGEQPADES